MINSDIFRPLVALGFGFCFGASFYFLSYYKSYRSIQDQFKEDVPDKIEEKSSLILEKSDSGCCQTEQSSPCCQTEKDTSSCCQTQQETACCQGEEEIPCADTSACCQTDGKTSAGCGTGESCCGTGSTNTTDTWSVSPDQGCRPVHNGQRSHSNGIDYAFLFPVFHFRCIIIARHSIEITKCSISFLVGSRSSTGCDFASEVSEYIAAFNPGVAIDTVDVTEVSIQKIEELFTEKSKNRLYVLILASYPDADFCENLRAYLDESAVDWRVGKGHLKQTAGMIPIILGDSTYGADVFCQPGIKIAKTFTVLGGCRSAHFEIDGIDEKPAKYFKDICRLIDETISYGEIEEPIDDGPESEDEGEEEQEDIDDLEALNTSCSRGPAIDLEDLGNVVPTNRGVKPNRSRVVKEMISDKLRTALTKQGYHLVGSHSGVKICRWTKNQLRGRGGCYKHSFYGIESHRCMEATPSLACANKCVFCWRHHTNPVGTEWRWVTDEPKMLVDEMLNGHRGMVKQLRGVPGVTSEKMVEAMNPVHCALSLVGEPIMYPRINEFLDYLHSHGISSYLVTNAQFPDAIKTLPPVTQLYASIDAASQAEMKAIDRPLHRDFWERFQSSLVNMKDVSGRTVYRLTLVAGFNLSDVEGYADLVHISNPDFIEVKGVTYCGTSNNAELSMKNVPWHDQVIEFCEGLADCLDDYSIACEHEHSNCVLLAHHRFRTENGWNTWIDYPKFQQLFDQWTEDGTEFSAVDYSVETPSWAVYGAEERGFDPNMKRHFRNRKVRTVPAGSNGPV